MAVSRHLIANDVGSNNSWPPRKIGIESGGRLWYIYEDTGNDINAMYSDDAGENWTKEDGFFINSMRNPSLHIDSADDVLASITNPTSANVPKYNKRTSGSWGSAENISSNSNAQFSQICCDSSDNPFCAWRYASAGTYDQIVANKRTGGSWGTPSALSLTAGWKANSITAVMDWNDNFHVIWQLQNIGDSTLYKVQTAYWDGSSWSSITDIESYSSSIASGAPIIRRAGNKLIALWSRDGVGTYTTKTQIRYSMCSVLDTWWTPNNMTDHDGHHYDYDITAGAGSDIYGIYTEYGADPSNPTIYNAAYKQWDGVSWSSKTVLTEESASQRFISAVNDGNTIHIIWRETSTTSLYHGSFTSTATPTTKEIYDYVDTIAADVDVTLSLEPQVVIPEVGGKGDIVHLADDESEERVGYSSDFKFYITIRFDLLNESDAGTLLDIWADSSKANGRINSWKFAHPDGHTYVVRFDTDLTRLMSPTYYTIKNIRLKVLGRIADS